MMLLSQRDAQAKAADGEDGGLKPYGAGKPVEPRTSDDSFDKHFEAAWKTSRANPDNQPDPEAPARDLTPYTPKKLEQEREQRRNGLDKHLEAAEAQHYAREDAQELADKTEPERRDLQTTFGDAGLKTFLVGMRNAVALLKADPSPRSRDYVKRLLLSQPIAREVVRLDAKQNVGAPVSDDSAPKGLDHHFERAWELHTTGKAAADAADRAALAGAEGKILDELFADMPREQALQQAYALFQEMKRDPHNTVDRLAAQLGHPATGTELAHEHNVAVTEQQLAQLQAAGYAPHADELQGEMMTVLANPKYRSNDPLRDFLAAHDFCVRCRNNGTSVKSALEFHEAKQEFGAIVEDMARTGRSAARDPAVQRAMIELVASDQVRTWDAAYARATGGDVYDRLTALEKARRAAPIAQSSGGAAGSGESPRSLDGHLNAALSNYSE